MKFALSRNWKIYALAVLFWLLLFVISAFMIDPTTGLPKFNLYEFHLVMFGVSTVLLYLFFAWFKKRGWVSDATFISFLLVNIALDFAILIPFFGVSVGEWVTLVLPSYLVGTALVHHLVVPKHTA